MARRERGSRGGLDSKSREKPSSVTESSDQQARQMAATMLTIYHEAIGQFPNEPVPKRVSGADEREIRNDIFDVWEHRAEQGVARRLLERFISEATSGAVHPLLLRFVAEGVREYLGGKSADQAFGLAKRAGRSGITRSKRLKVAKEYFRLRIELGEKEEVTISEIRTSFGLGETAIKDAWKAHKTSVFHEAIEERRRREADAKGSRLIDTASLWTESENDRLREEFGAILVANFFYEGWKTES